MGLQGIDLVGEHGVFSSFLVISMVATRGLLYPFIVTVLESRHRLFRVCHHALSLSVILFNKLHTTRKFLFSLEQKRSKRTTYEKKGY